MLLLNGNAFRYVSNYVTRRALSRLAALPCLYLVSFASPSLGADASLGRLLDSVEKRYNAAKTLQVSFEETLTGVGPKRVESGELALRKPGRMRWDYSAPAGKLFLADGKSIYYYSPTSKQAEKVPFKQSEDMRAPLAFLLGKLDFEKDFQGFKTAPQANGTLISADPKSDKLPYKHVDFLVTPDFRIAELRVLGFDQSVLTFRFSNERVNPALQDGIFKFELPAGATWAQSSTDGGVR